MTELEQRAAVVAEALTWERTPFMWEACVKGEGTDCARFIAASLNAAGVAHINIAQLPRLSPQWFLHREDGSYVNQIKKYAVEYDGKNPQPGDIVVARSGRDWAHGALVVNWPMVIGAAYGHCVTLWKDIRQSPQYATRELRFFDPWRARP